MTRSNHIAFVLICLTIVLTTLAYGTVHQPTIALFYISVAALFVLWGIDGITSGELRYSRSFVQVPLILTAVYGLIQVIPFGTYTGSDGISAIPRTISLEPFATQVTSLHILAHCACSFR